MLKILIYLLVVYNVSGLTCPPSCDPAKKSGCSVYTAHASCSQDVKDISSSQAHCGCLWQTYIQTVEPAARIIFTRPGKHCYLWANKVCSILENNERAKLKRKNSSKRPKTTVFNNSNDLKDILKRIQNLESIQNVGGHGKDGKGIAKKRRRNGVGTLSKKLEDFLNKEKQELRNAQMTSIKEMKNGTQLLTSKGIRKRHISAEYIGKPGKSGTVSWVEVVPKRNTKAPIRLLPTPFPPKVNNCDNAKNANTVRRHWIDLDMPVDQFKLGVFMIILLLNILVVLVLIFCRGTAQLAVTMFAKLPPTGQIPEGWLFNYESQTHGSDGATKQFENKKPAGDLNRDDYTPNGYKPDSQDNNGDNAGQKKKMISPLSVFLDSFKKKLLRAKKKENVSTQYLTLMDEHPEELTKNGNAYSKIRGNSPYIDAGLYRSPKRISRGLYEDIDEESEGLLDNTYETPISIQSDKADSREFHKRNFSMRSESSTEDESLPPSKYYAKESQTSSKSVSFSLSPKTYLTLQDRVDACPPVKSQETP